MFRAIQNLISLTDERKAKRLEQLREIRKSVALSHGDIKSMKKRIEALKQRKFRAYEQYSLEHISKEEYLARKESLDAEIAAIEAEVCSANERQETIQTEANSAGSELETVCDLFRNEKSLTYDMAHAFVDRILVYPDERVEIQFRFRDCLQEQIGE